jgi:hypothetical protein
MFPVLLAQAQPEPAFIGNWLIVGLMVLTVLIALVGGLFGFLAWFATRREFEGHVTEFKKHTEHNEGVHKDLFSKLGGIERGLRGEFREEIKTMRGEINEANSAAASLKATIEQLNQSLVGAQARIDRIVERE